MFANDLYDPNRKHSERDAIWITYDLTDQLTELDGSHHGEYLQASLAVEWLAARSEDSAPHIEYWRQLANVPWRNAFEGAFGIKFRDF